ncbi:terpene cyclase/mutase family protein [Aspergillus homomorphus CBS 101889]|uniref:Terpene cyclase/mutase family member n=1 Tax=Aspergillus homomorphus (strain CBS 101889) TaxID=1450537 RepID=A0A395HY82_ASPHC|nr:putative squalene-hopene-cyclase [Aspergillus homomorphus CBS 101889]RAL12395.1 putative squalene-hopene-cyclase [Aspergillus homomorphus CBS 101889]
MSQTVEIGSPVTKVTCQADYDPVLSRVHRSLELSLQHARDLMQPDGHWCGEVRTNATTTAEHILLCQALGVNLEADREAYISWLFSTQGSDGGWSLVPDHGGNISATVEAYLALKILGVSEDEREMRKARAYALAAGGVAKVRIFTRIYLALFGLFPWEAIPELPAELILIPSQLPVSLDRWSSWARATVIPLLIVSHHRPTYPLPAEISDHNHTYLDKLWCDPSNKVIPYTPPLAPSWNSDPFVSLFTVTDAILHRCNGLRFFNPLRRFARRKCVNWILEHQEITGDIGDIMPPLHGAMLALTLEGYSLNSDPIRRGLEAIERFACHDASGKRIQTTASACWDTSLMLIGLSDAGVTPDQQPMINNSLSWLQQRQILDQHGDWRVFNPDLHPGGFSFGYFNTWYPDVDDTACAILAMTRQDASLIHSPSVLHAVNWLLGMQNADGGWGAFDRDNNDWYLNKIPFSDMEGLCDPSTPDVTGHVLEAFGMFLAVGSSRRKPPSAYSACLDRINLAFRRAMYYLSATQEPSGAWYGRWGVNYIYGTSAVLCALPYFLHEKHCSTLLASDDSLAQEVAQAVRWLEIVQNADGGWGETVDSYRDPSQAGSGPSTASQTAWALMALLPYLRPSTEFIRRGVEYLLRTQVQTSSTGGKGATWHERAYTGTGFPNHFYFGYSFYAHYFPMMALGRYAYAAGGRPCLEWGNN